ncbi:MAG: DoxX family membrane protein [bacterium]|nr:DoxX family membrane protein [bacterium]
MKLPSNTVYASWLALVRLYVGAFWLMHGIPKFTQSQDFMPPNGMIESFIASATTNTSGWYHHFLTSVVAPNINIFAELVRLGEVVTGTLLLLGAFTRLGGLLGVLLSLNYLTAKGGLAHLSMWSSLDSAALVLSAINVMLPTGRVLGIDALLGRKRAPAPVPVATVPQQEAVFVEEPPMTGPTAPTS